MRMAGAAALGTVAYQSGKHHAQQADYNEQAQADYEATQQMPVAAPQPEVGAAPAPAAVGAPADDPTAQLERLAQLHQSGSLSDEEFTAAKSKLLGI
jgi:hypothetical protein